MNSDKLTLIKKIVEQQLNSIDFDKEIERNEKVLTELRETPADEYSLSGNIEYGITNLLETATGVTHPIGFLTAKKGALKGFLNLFEKDIEQLKGILNPEPIEDDTSWKDDFFEKLNSKDRPIKKHFYDCTLTDEDWGSENCICPGSYIYRKYLSIGLSEKEAKLISDYRELGDLMEDKKRFSDGEKLYQKNKFLNVANLK